MKRHLLLTLQYRGTRYHGYQVQKNACTVAETVQDAVEKVFGERLAIKGCSRTDAGVHANRFALTLRTETSIACDALVRAMNVHLPEDIAVRAVREVADDFHPRYSCTGKRYIYKIWNAPEKDAFLSDLALHHKYRLEERRMDAASQAFLGVHDFSAFCSAGGSAGDTVREIMACSVHREGALVVFSVTGSGFLYNMVRIMVGSLLPTSRRNVTPEEIQAAILSGDRGRAGPTVPAHGLYLDAIFYEKDGFVIE